VRPLDAPNIRRQARFDPLPLLIAQPKQVSAHDPNPLPKTNQDRIVRAEKLMSSDPTQGNLTESNPSRKSAAAPSNIGATGSRKLIRPTARQRVVIEQLWEDKLWRRSQFTRQ